MNNEWSYSISAGAPTRTRKAKYKLRLPLLAIGDIHFPWPNADWLNWVGELADQLKPQTIVQMGDLYDSYSSSRYPRDFDVASPEEELALAREYAVKMWKGLQSICPTAQCFQLVGNHDDRPIKRALEKAPDLLPYVSPTWRDMFKFDKVITIYDPKEELFLGDIALHHGHRSKLGDHAKYNGCKTIVAHSHVGGCVSHQTKLGNAWELNCGWGGDITKRPFGYRAQKNIHKTTLGVGLVDELGPRFIPFK